MLNKISEAQRLIEQVYSTYNAPAFMCSFGKDSMVLLSIIEQMGLRFPIIFHRDPWWPKKYKFSDEQIAQRELEVHDYPPLAMTLWDGKHNVLCFPLSDRK